MVQSKWASEFYIWTTNFHIINIDSMEWFLYKMCHIQSCLKWTWIGSNIAVDSVTNMQLSWLTITIFARVVYSNSEYSKENFISDLIRFEFETSADWKSNIFLPMLLDVCLMHVCTVRWIFYQKFSSIFLWTLLNTARCYFTYECWNQNIFITQ